ncbi:phosphodiester glycosidase family protein [Arthrobacter castelli]|uniref:phosphodiester glycosidase family protein n=1 Tax=Arthrobacter castelli TaxID=271431 RepID=UPI000414B38D|nr:phosphodiester glycosidase family protein [Arthrobacter castelli]
MSFFTDEFSNTTPALKGGFEAVLNKQYCVIGTNTSGRTALAEDEYAVQATGSEAAALRALVDGGNRCPDYDSELIDENGKRITLNKHTYAVNGRVNLIDDGAIVAEHRPEDPFYVRHPRTIAGTTEDGTIKFIVIDGRSTSSVGATIQESAQTAQDLGLVDAINLDGGGSSTMSIKGDVANEPSGETPRSVGDALVWVPKKNE